MAYHALMFMGVMTFMFALSWPFMLVFEKWVWDINRSIAPKQTHTQNTVIQIIKKLVIIGSVNALGRNNLQAKWLSKN